jgi:hypothetical protein
MEPCLRNISAEEMRLWIMVSMASTTFLSSALGSSLCTAFYKQYRFSCSELCFEHLFIYINLPVHDCIWAHTLAVLMGHR